MIKPAIEGGKPERKEFLVFGKPKISSKEINEVVKTLKSGWIGTGPKTKIFEQKFKDYIGCNNAVALNSCTAGLHLALDVIGIKPDDIVITTPLTFASTANVIIHHKAIPFFVDVDIDNGNISLKNIEKSLIKQVKAIIPVDLYGLPCEISEINQLAKRNKSYVIEDAAHCLEGIYKGKKIGTISDFTAFSFYATKNLTTGEGGMLTTNNNDWADEARIRSLHGISKDAWKRYSTSGFKNYETLYPGYKYNMIDLLSSIGIHQIDKIKSNSKIRKKYWEYYNQQFKNVKEINIPKDSYKDRLHAMHLYTIQLKLERLKINRNQFIEALKAENIGTGIHFTALHLHKYYQNSFGYKKGDFPNAEFIGERTVSLPFTTSLTVRDLHDVVNSILKIIQFYRK